MGPDNLRYTDQHEWVADQDGVATIGVTAYAADALGDVVYVQLPDVGTRVTEGEACGEIESTKSVSELFAPLTGEVVEVNAAVLDKPELVNTDPFGDGWLVKVRHAGLPDLLDPQAYHALTEEA
jgi:glycine cleavage system H protein